MCSFAITYDIILSQSHLLFYSQIAAGLDDLAAECRKYLESLHFELGQPGPKYDRVSLALEICKWMNEKGFLPAIGTWALLKFARI